MVTVTRISAHGRGAIGTIEVRGPGARQLLARHFSGTISSTRVRYGSFLDASGQVIDDGVVVPVPSLVGGTAAGLSGARLAEECFWTTLHGNPLLLQRWVEVLVASGAEPAPAKTGAAAAPSGDPHVDHSAADHSAADDSVTDDPLWGPPRNRIAAEAERLLPSARSWGALAFLAEQRETGLAAWCDAGQPTLAAVEAMLEVAPRGVSLFRPVRVVLAGAPNAGKSTLFNTFLGRRRVITHDTPGTTRDLISEEVLIGDYPVLLQDGAGIRETTDVVERSGVERVQAALVGADVVVWLRSAESVRPHDSERDRGDPSQPPRGLSVPVIEVVSKCDLLPDGTAAAQTAGLRFSANTGVGLSELRRTILLAAIGSSDVPAGAPCPFLPRHVGLLEEIRARQLRGDSIAATLDELRGRSE